MAFVVGVVVGRDTPHGALDVADNPVLATPAASQPPRLVIVGEPEGEPTDDALDEVTYPDRLRAGAQPDETFRSLPLYATGLTRPLPEPVAAAESRPAELPDPDAVAASAVDAAGAAGAASTVVAEAVPAPPESDPYAVQVAALRVAEAAEAFAGRLIAKGFPAYVLEPSSEGPVAVYRVRVGPFADHGEAEQVRLRLEQEMQLKPWITR